MTQSVPIESPSGYAPLNAVGRAMADGRCEAVSQDSPLPVALVVPGAGAPLEGMAAQPTLAGPFASVCGRPVMLTLAGQWTGSVRVMRSVDGGSTRHPLTLGGQEWGLYSGPACEWVWEEHENGAQLWLDMAPTSGTITYRVSQ